MVTNFILEMIGILNECSSQEILNRIINKHMHICTMNLEKHRIWM